MLEKSKLTPWVMWILALVFYFYQFIIRVATGNIRDPLTIEFNLTASEFGLFASYWLVSYALLQIPAGIALDKWGVKKVFVGSALLCGAGALLMAQANSFSILCISRLLIGAGSASAFVGTIKISSEWFNPNMLPILVGVVSAGGVMGASLAGAPMVVLQSYIGWRTIFLSLSIIAFGLAILYSFLLRDKKLEQTITFQEIKKQLVSIIIEPQMWLLGTIGFLLYTPVSVLADLWGPSFMKVVYSCDSITSALATSFIFYGNAIGSFFAGWVFLRFATNKQYFTFFMAIAAVLMFCIVWLNISNFLVLCLVLLGLGCLVGAENLVFPLGARYAAKGYQGLSASVINFLVMVGAIILQPGIGLIMDLMWDGAIENGVPAYSALQYRYGLSTLIGSLFLGFLLSFGVKGKTKC